MHAATGMAIFGIPLSGDEAGAAATAITIYCDEATVFHAGAQRATEYHAGASESKAFHAGAQRTQVRT